VKGKRKEGGKPFDPKENILPVREKKGHFWAWELLGAKDHPEQ